jgi:protein-tyrosine phosphatase
VADAVSFVDIHCHLLPGIDDGAKTWDESIAMARMAVADGVTAIVVTPHQLGSYGHNSGLEIRHRTQQLQQMLHEQGVALQVRPGADVRIEGNMLELLRRGDVLTLGDHRRYVLLELPHELYFPIEGVLQELEGAGMQGVLSHPERNQGLLKRPQEVEELVAAGCWMQITAGSLLGTFGPGPQDMAEWMVRQGLAHFLASDAHGCRSRRPLLRQAYQRTCELAGAEMARRLCCDNPAAIFAGQIVHPLPRAAPSRRWPKWLPWRRAA